MEKFTQAPVGLDIDQTVSSNSEAIAKLNSAEVVTIGSLDALKTSLNNIASGMKTGTSVFYSMIATATFSAFTNNHIYSGYLKVTFKGPTSIRFVIELSDSQGNTVVVGNEVGTWTIQQLVTKSNVGKYNSAGNETGSNEVSLPQDWDMLYIIAYNGSYWKYTYMIDRQSVSNGFTYFRNGYDNQNYCSIAVSLTAAKLDTFVVSGSNVTSNSNIGVRYI